MRFPSHNFLGTNRLESNKNLKSYRFSMKKSKFLETFFRECVTIEDQFWKKMYIFENTIKEYFFTLLPTKQLPHEQTNKNDLELQIFAKLCFVNFVEKYC